MQHKFEYLDELQELVSTGKVRKNDHKTLPLSIYCYRGEALAPDFIWTPCARAARGLVLDKDGYVVTRSFARFDNIETVDPKNIPSGPYCAVEKVDGSLINISSYGGQSLITSRGSFTSDVVGLAQEVIQERGPLSHTPTNCTSSFELIHPKNRILVNYYGEKRLVFLGAHRADGSEVENPGHPCFGGWPTYSPKRSMINPEEDHPDESVFEYWKRQFIERPCSASNGEGFVLYWPNGFRVKAKRPEYKEAHRNTPIFGDIRKTYLEALIREKGAEFRGKIPADMEERHKAMDDVDEEIWEHIRHAEALRASTARRDVARQSPKYAPLVFACFDAEHTTGKQSGEDVRLRGIAARILLKESKS